MKRIISLIWLGVFAAAAGIAPIMATGNQETGTLPSGGAGGVASILATATPIDDVASYAQGFRAYRSGSLTIVQITRPWQNAGSGDVLTYVLYPRTEDAPDVPDADLVVGVPIRSIATMSTTFLPHLTVLDAMDTLVAIDSAAYAYAPEVHDLVNSGKVVEVGSGPDVDVEQLLALAPELIMVNSYGGEWDAQPTLEEAGLPVVVAGDWVENDPLGRAEWLLFTSLFYDELDVGLATFRRVAREYDRLTTLTTGIADRPRVLINAPYQGTWAVAGGASYAAQFLRDAGADYVWADDTTSGSIFLDIETVYAEAGDADIWINPGAWASLAQGAAEDERFTSFRAFKDGQVYNNNRRMGPGGGNDYFESGAINPNIILNDLIWVVHPELVPDYEPYYYQKLE